MKSDAQLKKDVEAELEWDPSINATEVGVAVKDGVVTLVVPTSEMGQGTQEALAREAFTLASAKLPLKCTFVARAIGA